MTPTNLAPPEYNVTGIDYSDRKHFRYSGPIIDFHSHVMITRPGDPPTGPPTGTGPGASIAQAETMLAVAREFGIGQTVSMCLPDDIPILRDRFGNQLLFNGPISKKKKEDADEEAYRLLDQYLNHGVRIIKYWSAPRGRERGLLVDAPWRIETTRRAIQAGIRLFMVHVADPDAWFRTVYADESKFGSKMDQYSGFERMLEMFPSVNWIAAHMGGDPEHPDHLENMLVKYPHLYLDTSATKWQIREVSPRREAITRLMEKFSDRFLFGTDLVTRHFLEREHYVSRYWCQRTLWESEWEGPSPIQDGDYTPQAGEPSQPQLRGLNLPLDVLKKVYFENAKKLLAN